jgi:hypothetical protein
VIQDFQGVVYDIVWIKSSNVNYLVAGCSDGVVGMWQVLVDEDHCDVSLRWKTTSGELDMKDATIQDVQGLSQLNRKLLKQRGAVGEPADRLREAGKKVTTMVSVVAKLKGASESAAVEGPSFPGSDAIKELEQKFEQKFQQAKVSLSQAKNSLLQANDSLSQTNDSLLQAKDSFLQDVMAMVENNIQGCE